MQDAQLTKSGLLFTAPENYKTENNQEQFRIITDNITENPQTKY